jgi:hypothetical protein
MYIAIAFDIKEHKIYGCAGSPNKEECERICKRIMKKEGIENLPYHIFTSNTTEGFMFEYMTYCEELGVEEGVANKMIEALIKEIES